MHLRKTRINKFPVIQSREQENASSRTSQIELIRNVFLTIFKIRDLTEVCFKSTVPVSNYLRFIKLFLVPLEYV